MNLRHLHYFTEIASTGSLRRASEVLYVTQSALSRAVSELEAEFGCALLDRSQKGVTPTPRGLALLERAKLIISDVDQLKAVLAKDSVAPTSHVRLALPIGVRNSMTRPLVKTLREAHPNMRVDVADGNAHENRNAVLDGSADLTVILELDRGLPLSYRRLYGDALCLVGPKSASLDSSATAPLSMLADLPLLLIRAPNQIRWAVDSELRRMKTKKDPTMEVSSSLLLIDLVEDGHGYTVLPQSLLDELEDDRRVSWAPLSKMSITWVVAWSKAKPLTPAARTVVDALVDICDRRNKHRV